MTSQIMGSPWDICELVLSPITNNSDLIILGCTLEVRGSFLIESKGELRSELRVYVLLLKWGLWTCSSKHSLEGF